jgi:hypothetical protein
MNFRSQTRFQIVPIPVRGHTLLCLQGFRGEGYDPMFTAHMSAIHQRLSNQPKLLVKVIIRPDTFCHSCPHLSSDQGCNLHGAGSEVEMIEQDQEVMGMLGIENEEILEWKTVLTKIGENIKPEMLDEICGQCPWLPLGYCKDGLSNPEGASPSSLQHKKE